MTDVQKLLDRELQLYLRKAQAALEFSPDFAERHRLAHWITLLQLEIERRKRSGAPVEHDPRASEEIREQLRDALDKEDEK